MGKPAGLVFLILGLVLGPGHYIYTRFFTGRVVLEQPLPFSADAGNRMQASLNLSLEPDMLPAEVILQFTATHGPVMSPPNTPQNHYRARLFKNGELVQEKSFSLQSKMVEATPAIPFSEAISLPSDLQAGDYRLAVYQEGEAGMEITGSRLQLRAGVGQADSNLLAIGLGLIAAGLVILLLSP